MRQLRGGDPRSLKGVDRVVKQVLSDKKRLIELFELLFSEDEIIRMRASDALEKVCRQKPEWFKPFIERLSNEVSTIKQPSVQWHLAQMFYQISMDKQQTQKALKIMSSNLAQMDDWIVTNLTIESLSNFARRGDLPKHEFLKILEKHQNSRHKSVTNRARKLINELSA